MIPDPLSRTFLQGYLPGFCRSVDLVIAPSQGLLGVMRELGVDAPIEVVPNGVELEPFQRPTPVPRSTLGLGPDDLALIYVGRLGLEKNVAFLLADVRRRSQRRSGTPAWSSSAAARKWRTCEAWPRISGWPAPSTSPARFPIQRVPGLLAACDAFVTASVSEVHPLSVIEAMAAGLPVVGIEGPGVGDTVHDGVDGFLSTYDSASFSAKLTRLVLDDGLRRRMAEAAARTAQAYDIDRTSAAVEGHYRSLLTRPRSPRPSRWETTWRQIFDRLT